jgi:hypothetical protein
VTTGWASADAVGRARRRAYRSMQADIKERE